jgi:hypothetical protein
MAPNATTDPSDVKLEGGSTWPTWYHNYQLNARMRAFRIRMVRDRKARTISLVHDAYIEKVGTR